MKKYYFYVILAAAFWGIISIFIKGLNIAGFSSIEIVAVRVFFLLFC